MLPSPQCFPNDYALHVSNGKYRQNSNINHTLVDNKIVDHSDVVGASPVRAAPATSSFATYTPGFDGFGKDSCKMRRETFKFCDLVWFILEIWW